MDVLFIRNIFFCIWVIGAIGIVYFRVRKAIRIKAIQREVKNLSLNLNDTGVFEFIRFVQRCGIPNKPESWKALRASWELVYQSDQISQHLKKDLRTTLLGRGVNL